MKWWWKADRGELEPFVLVVEGSIPNEAIKKEGYWAGVGTTRATGQPMTTSQWVDRLAPKALAVLAVGTCATYGGIHAMQGNPTGAMGLARLSRVELAVEGRTSRGVRARLPRASRQPVMRRSSTCSDQAAGVAPMIPLDQELRPTWLFGTPSTRAATAAGTTSRATSPRSTGHPSAS